MINSHINKIISSFIKYKTYYLNILLFLICFNSIGLNWENNNNFSYLFCPWVIL